MRPGRPRRIASKELNSTLFLLSFLSSFFCLIFRSGYSDGEACGVLGLLDGDAATHGARVQGGGASARRRCVGNLPRSSEEERARRTGKTASTPCRRVGGRKVWPVLTERSKRWTCHTQKGFVCFQTSKRWTTVLLTIFIYKIQELCVCSLALLQRFCVCNGVVGGFFFDLGAACCCARLARGKRWSSSWLFDVQPSDLIFGREWEEGAPAHRAAHEGNRQKKGDDEPLFVKSWSSSCVASSEPLCSLRYNT